ncbi:MAG: hypothetical protein KDE53_13570 [Caldilineaceae bacterium]|nr:hypothetical protein [Caldilineaceae bacterium]MCB0187783.1 hypothetical protein [Caldilineaceae bacterium]
MIETNPHLRPAQVGDICLLIEPDPQTNIAPLRSYQASLHTRFGGCPTRHVHLTCQRFCGGKESRLDQSLSAIEQLSSLLMPLPLNAVALHTLPVPILQTTTLKWQIDVTSELLAFNEAVEDALRRADFIPQYAPGFTSNLVTALQDIADDLQDDGLADPQLPYHLFDAQKVVVSQICGPGKFKILAKIDTCCAPV